VTRVGITGASGFLGTALTEHLAALPGIDVVALTRTLPVGLGTPDSNVEWRQGDLASPSDAASFVENLDCIVHLAHKGSPLTSGRDLASDAVANLVPLLTMLETIRGRRRSCHVVYASSGGALYAGTRPGVAATESSPVQLTSSYAIQKLAGEQYLRLASDEGWLTATILRIGNAYGAILRPDRLQGFLGVAVARLVADEPIRLIGDPRNVRDYVHLTDVNNAFALVMEPRSAYDVFNIGSGEGTSIDELIALLGEVSGVNPRVELVDDNPAANRLPRWVILDATKAKAALGWETTISLREGIERLWQMATR
jgi:UDP-glucose 4-epimerase